MRGLSRSVLAVLVIAALGACGDDSDDSGASNTRSGSNTTSPADPGATSGLPDPCTLLDERAVEAALGSVKPGEPATAGGSAPAQYRGCTWGVISDDGGLLAIQISQASGEANINYVKTITATAGEGKPIDVGTNGKLLDRAFVPGGGGVGRSIVFDQGATTVVVAMTKGDDAKLEAAARAARANLG
jgi:hypothetical protein